MKRKKKSWIPKLEKLMKELVEQMDEIVLSIETSKVKKKKKKK